MKTTRVLTLPLRIAIIIIILGALFKIMHWPYAQQLLLIGSTSTMILYTIRFWYKKDKVRLDYIKLGLVTLWIFSYCNQALHLLNLPYYFEIVVLVLFVWWFIKEGLSYFNNRQLKGNLVVKLLYYILILMSVCCIVLGALFKI